MAELICPSCGTTSNNGYCTNCMSWIPREPEPSEYEAFGEDENVVSSAQESGENEGKDSCSNGNSPIAGNSFGQQRLAHVENDMQSLQSSNLVACGNCGMKGVPGQECQQCGEILPKAQSETARKDESMLCNGGVELSAFLVLPRGVQLKLEDGKEYIIGRESDNYEIKHAFDGYMTVSRKHCAIRLNHAQHTVEVREINSTNGTFIGNNRRRLCEKEIVPIPETIWLGSSVSISIK